MIKKEGTRVLGLLAEKAGRYFNETTVKVLTAVIFVVFGIQAIRKGLFRSGGNDLDIFLNSANLFFSGNNPYENAILLYPLFGMFIMQPFNAIPLWMAHFLWYVINFGIFLLALRVAQTRAIGGEFRWLPFGITFIALLGIFQNNMLNAQINILVMSCALAFMVFLKEGRKTLAALFLAAAISIKLTPLFFLLFILVNREFSVFLKTVLFTAALALFIPYIALGGAVWGYYETYYDVILGQMSIGHDAGRVFSIGGLINRLVTFRYSYVIIALLTVAAAGGIQYAINRKVGKASLRVLYLYFLIALLATPISETHHLLWFFPPVLGIISDLYSGANTTYRAKPMIAMMTVFVLTYNLSRYLPHGNPGPFLSILMLFGMTVFWALDEKKE